MDISRRRRDDLLVPTMTCRKRFILLLTGAFVLLISSACQRSKEPNIDLRNDAQFVNLKEINSTFLIDSRYATKNNFIGIRLYPENELFLLKPVAQRLSRVQERLVPLRLRLKILDAYRPLRVQRKMWEIVPDERYVANPSKGSNHNRGCAVDVTLVDDKGDELPMPSGFDDFTERAHSQFMDLPTNILRNRQTLRDAMMSEGFVPFPTEWWHFDDPECSKWPSLDFNPYKGSFFPDEKQSDR